MKNYIIKRLLLSVPVILSITILIFLIMEITPGDPARLILGNNATDEAVKILRKDLKLDRPMVVRYLDYMLGAFRGDFGVSYITGIPVSKEISNRIGYTFNIALLAMSFTAFLGVPLGIISAVKQYTAIDSILMFLALIFASMPSFWIGLLLILVFSVNLNLLPAFGVDGWQNYILPVLTLALTGAAVEARITRSSMLEVLRADFMRTARAKGINEKKVILKHAMRNALLPIVTIVGGDFGVLLGGAVVIETVFGIPGIGSMIVSAIRVKDIPLVMTGVIIIAVSFSLVNLIIDLLYAFIDPRIKTAFE